MTIPHLLQPEPAGIVGALLQSKAARRSNTAGQVVEQARLIGQRLALPIDWVVDLTCGGVPRGGGRPNDLENQCPVMSDVAVVGSARDPIDAGGRSARAAAQ